ncbi:MAG TPA: DUF503 domain-containing protein [Steroidobacteraceae bacterium]|jgi:uncharacterized protein YlxP (DUF503 family)|nr:DUF503 domain-containing protein [Steroidobacteraceae bacterium]
MVIGTLTITLQVPDSASLKDKRQVVRSLTARIRQRFNVAVAEVEDQNLWQSAVIGIACVSADGRHADEMCQKVLRFVDERGDALILDSRFELVHV